jgi:hypothetical protein
MTGCGDGNGEVTLHHCGDAGGELRHCHDDELPADPFVALRVAFGMLLGEDDFRVLMGNPRGKQMLHAAWLHGPGVVWGLPVRHDKGTLRVEEGLAYDAVGRALRLEVSQCLDLAEWARERLERRPPAKGEDKVTAWVVARFFSCPDRPVPAVADPCDVSRQHDSFSRVVETARIEVLDDPPPEPWPYRRLRVLLGLLEGDPSADQEALEAQAKVREAAPDERAGELLRQFRLLAAREAVERRPAQWGDEDCLPQFPVPEEDAGVLLAKLHFEVDDDQDCVRIGPVAVDPDVRTAILPTTTIQELLCGLAPGLLGPDAIPDAGGPRLLPGSVSWSHGNTRVAFAVDRPLARGSWEGAIHVSSLSDNGHGWRREHINGFRLEADGRRAVVTLDGRPAYETVRLLIRGTGRTPLFGKDPHVPFAGVHGGPPGTEHDGHDAAVTTRLGAGTYADDAPTPGEAAR